ncbi:hypothetical protein [Alteribacter natronophilus]|uniref:hypothetical protein n=1 Tax=Alteribacter natronophilus TaxID=2583810 RepID=UPI00110F032B|nr:hypothetical protein [Alteribacter natronophilus]TMW71270.1 hypothetical protein FGB90_15090 [Alteribacter natronophilus]
MKHTAGQIFFSAVLVTLVFFLERFTGGQVSIQASAGGGTAVNSSFVIFFISSGILTCIYAVFFLEAEKENSLFQSPFWSKMPVLSAVWGLVSVTALVTAFLTMPMSDLMGGGTAFFYSLIIYFLFLVFLFVFSIENRKRKHSYSEAVHRSFGFTIVLFFVLYVVM